jgi:hypothetical protein
MLLLRTRSCVSAILAITMLASSAASAAPAPAPNNIDPYVALSVLSTAGPPAAGSMAAVSAGSAVATEAAATQDPYDGTPRGSMMPLWVALGVVFAGWLWILLDNNNHHHGGGTPVSPA